jgi:hypothetical protein
MAEKIIQTIQSHDYNKRISAFHKMKIGIEKSQISEIEQQPNLTGDEKRTLACIKNTVKYRARVCAWKRVINSQLESELNNVPLHAKHVYE